MARWHTEALAYCALGASLLSLVAALSVIVAYAIQFLSAIVRVFNARHMDDEQRLGMDKQRHSSSKKRSRPLKRLVFGLIASQAGLALSKVVSSIYVLSDESLTLGALCDASGFLGETFSFTNALYILSICCFMLLIVHDIKIRPIYEIGTHIVSWMLPAIISVLPMIPAVTSSLGWRYTWAGAWCFVGASPKYLRFVVLYMWVWMVFSITALIYGYIFFVTRRMQQRDFSLMVDKKKRRKMKSAMRQLALYPLAYIILWTPATINRSLENFSHPLFVFALMEALLLPLQGFVDCALYAYVTLRRPKKKNSHHKIQRWSAQRSLESFDFIDPKQDALDSEGQ